MKVLYLEVTVRSTDYRIESTEYRMENTDTDISCATLVGCCMNINPTVSKARLALHCDSSRGIN